jgi:hypothetical protein
MSFKVVVLKSLLGRSVAKAALRSLEVSGGRAEGTLASAMAGSGTAAWDKGRIGIGG